MRTVVFHNSKGGVGKTTTAVHVGMSLARAGKRVLLVDFDTQGSATQWLAEEDEGSRIVQALRREDFRGVPIRLRENFDLVPSGDELATEGRKVLDKAKDYGVLSRALATVADRYDVAIIDNQPSIASAAPWNGLIAADRAIVPCECSFLSLTGLAQFMRILEAAQGENAALKLLGIIPSRTVRTTNGREALAQLEEQFPGRVFPSIPETVIVRTAQGDQKTVFDIAPKHPICAVFDAIATRIWEDME